ncbi:MAG TPA: SMC-Scp complex subunit ScpB [Pseudomonadales bacterium]
MTVAPDLLKNIVEAALLAAGKPLNLAQIQALFDDDEKPGKAEVEAAVEDIRTDMGERGFELVEVASGWRFQVREPMAPWISRLWEEKPQKYSRALLETLALVAYRQPITRGEIEEIRGVAVSSHIMKTLQERNWVKVVGHRDVPGRPAMYATTRDFLDYFNLKSLDQLPTLAEIRDLDSLNQELNLALDGEADGQQGMGETPPLPEPADNDAAVPVMSAHDNDDDAEQESML